MILGSNSRTVLTTDSRRLLELMIMSGRREIRTPKAVTLVQVQTGCHHQLACSSILKNTSCYIKVRIKKVPGDGIEPPTKENPLDWSASAKCQHNPREPSIIHIFEVCYFLFVSNPGIV